MGGRKFIRETSFTGELQHIQMPLAGRQRTFRNLLPMLLLAMIVASSGILPARQSNVGSDQPSFRVLDMGEGMRVSKVTGAIQDASGEMWFGSVEGLFRYNGASFIHYHTLNKEHPLPVKKVYRLISGRHDDELIFHGEKKICVLNSAENSIHEIQYGPAGPLEEGMRRPQLVLDQRQVLWLGIQVRELDADGVLAGSVFHLFKSEDFQTFSFVAKYRSELIRNELYHGGLVELTEWRGQLVMNLNKSVVRLDQQGRIVETYPFPGGYPAGHFVDAQDNLWVISLAPGFGSKQEDKAPGGIYYLEPNGNNFQEFPIQDHALIDRTASLFVEPDRIIGFGGAVALIDRKSGTGHSYNQELKDINSYFFQSALHIIELTRDQTGVYWLAGNDMFLMDDPPAIDHYLQSGSGFCTDHKGEIDYQCPIRGFAEDASGRIYISPGKGLLRLDPRTDEIVSLIELYSKTYDAWEPWNISYYQGMLFVDNYTIDLNTGDQTFLFKNRRDQDHHVFDQEGKIWYGMYRGTLKIYDPERGTLKNFPAISEDLGIDQLFIWALVPQKKSGGMWVVTQDHGLILVHQQHGVQKHFTYEPGNEAGLLSDELYCAAEDEDGKLWIGSSLGLSKMDVPTETFIHYRTSDGLPSASVKSMILDPGKGIWLGTNNGLSYFDFANETFYNFSEKEGLANTRFNQHAAFQSRSGKLYFGGLNGVDAFYPEALLNPELNRTIPINLLEMNQFDGEENLRQTRNLAQLSTLRLRPDIQYFDLKFRLADYRAGANTLYQYRLEGYEQEWSTPSYQNTLRYDNTPPGTYTLRIRASLSPTVWSENELVLQVIKRQYWFKTFWAYLGLIAVLGALSFFIYRAQLNRKLEQAEARRILELDSLKTKLYTNITHEFRTPLTVIKGMAEQMKGDREAKSLIRRNSKKLLMLVTQMLDMAKLESGKMQLKLIRRNVISYLAYLTSSFQSLAETKSIKLTFDAAVSELMMDFDAEKLQHVMANLISNAIKFTHETGTVSVHVSGSPTQLNTKHNPLLKIRVRDNGVGIDEEHLPHIFDRFYQVDDTHTRWAAGTGIGLALTKELVEVMGGTISVQSTYFEGTEFTVLLPIKRLEGTQLATSDPDLELLPEAEPLPAIPITSETSAGNTDLPLLLLIEDNADVVTYIRTCLDAHYNVQVAFDGQAGIDQAIRSIPDVIISDIMMPKKDGYEVTRELKQDERTSHIPIIMLTAKADLDSKIEGLTRGADAYLIKPFEKEELLVRLSKLIELRRKLQERYASLAPLVPSQDVAVQVEDAFLSKVREAVEERMDDPAFNVERLCKHLGLSQSQLYRKVKALTDKSIAAFVRQIRLQKGKQLLETTDMTVSEVAYDVGFSDPAYFSKSFSKEFGMPPSEVKR